MCTTNKAKNIEVGQVLVRFLCCGFFCVFFFFFQTTPPEEMRSAIQNLYY